MIALAIAMSVMVAQGEATQASPRLTVGEWKGQDASRRRILIMGAIEGLALAASGPRGDESGIDAACLANIRPSDVDVKLQQAMNASPFVLSVMEAGGC